ncbi:MAG: hypothetical protein PW788_10645 [Micavibrio sp.]|nr:hypothetical protein [Micavibrio sp.]
MPKHQAPMGIMASFSTVSFKKDGAEVFSASVSSGGCFGPDDDIKVITRGFDEMKRQGKAATADFNSVALKPQFGSSTREYKVAVKNAQIDAKSLKRI